LNKVVLFLFSYAALRLERAKRTGVRRF